MFGLLAGLGDPSLDVLDLGTGKELLVFLELPFEAEVGTNFGPGFSYESDGLLEALVVLPHEIGNDQGGRLVESKGTLEMPAAQCTSTLPSERCCSRIWWAGANSRLMF